MNFEWKGDGMKRRILTALCVLPFLLALSALLACNLHCILSGESGFFIWKPQTVLAMLTTVKNVRLFFLAFAACCLLLLLACLVSGGNVRYRNSTVQIVPGLAIPVSAGNGEYGTACFMPKRMLRRVFSRQKLSAIRKLRKEMKKHE